MRSAIYRGIACICIAMTVFSSFGLNLANTYRVDIDTALETSSYESEMDSTYQYEATYDADGLIQAHKDLGERLIEEGSVLLKNDGALPLKGNQDQLNVTLFGMRSFLPQFGGTVNANPNARQNVGMATAFNERGINCNPDMIAFYEKYAGDYPPGLAIGANNENVEKATVVNEVPRELYSEAPRNYSDYKDAAIIVLGRDCTEANDYYPGAAGIANPEEFSKSTTGNILGLSDDEMDLIQYVKDQGVFDRIVVLINSTPTMEIKSLKDDEAIDSILWIGTPGNYGFYGVADLLKGTVSPSGHLADTYAVNTALSPAAQNMGVYVYSNASDIDESFDAGSRILRNSWYVAELESIYTGYKYYETRYFDSLVNPHSGAADNVASSSTDGWDYDNEVVYGFGYGLSYSTFDEEIVSSDIHLDGPSSVEVKVTNTGDVAGKHAVQLYVAQPYEAGQVEKPAIQLVAYEKTGDALEESDNRVISDSILLSPGESETLTLTFDRQLFASYDENEGNGAYVLDQGQYAFAIGNGAHDALNNVLIHQGYLDGKADGKVVTLDNASKMVIDQSQAGVEIKNQLQDMDLNNLGYDVTYLSRNDWSGTFPQEMDNLEATDEMLKGLENSFYDPSNYQTSDLPTYTFGETDVPGEHKLAEAIGETDYDAPIYDDILKGVPLTTMIDGTSNAFQRIAAIPEVGSPEVRSMGGIVGLIARMGRYNPEGSQYAMDPEDPNAKYNTNTFVTEPVVASTYSHRMASLQGDVLGNDTLWTGLKWWYGIGANNHRTPYNARNNEYYSEDAVLTGLMAKDVAHKVNQYGGITGIKHFAFNDQESNREGVSVYMSEQMARENELRGFQIPIEAGNISSVMTAYNRAGSVYSSAHEGLITGILRDEWAYHKIVITDMIHGGESYMLPWESLVAGTDMIMSSSNFWDDFNLAEIEKDPVMQASLHEAWHHILYTVANSNAMNGLSIETEVKRLYPWWEVLIMSLIVISALGTLVFTFLAWRSLRKNNKKEA